MLKMELNIWKPFAVTLYCIFEFYTNRFGPQHTVCKKSILWIRNITCCFWKRSMHYTTRKNFTLWDLVQQGLRNLKKKKKKYGNGKWWSWLWWCFDDFDNNIFDDGNCSLSGVRSLCHLPHDPQWSHDIQRQMGQMLDEHCSFVRWFKKYI